MVLVVVVEVVFCMPINRRMETEGFDEDCPMTNFFSTDTQFMSKNALILTVNFAPLIGMCTQPQHFF